MQKEAHDAHVLKKIGEVYAFTQVGLETFERGEAAFVQVFSEDEYDAVLKSLGELKDELDEFILHTEDDAIIVAKSEGTAGKLANMRDLYINDQWDDQMELLEWLGFFQGAAFVHWGLIYGFTTGGFIPKLADTAQKAMGFNENLLHRVKDLLVEEGSAY